MKVGTEAGGAKEGVANPLWEDQLKLGSAVLAMALLSGCYDVDLYIRSDGSGLRTETIRLDRSLYDSISSTFPLDQLDEQKVEAFIHARNPKMRFVSYKSWWRPDAEGNSLGSRYLTATAEFKKAEDLSLPGAHSEWFYKGRGVYSFVFGINPNFVWETILMDDEAPKFKSVMASRVIEGIMRVRAQFQGDITSYNWASDVTKNDEWIEWELDLAELQEEPVTVMVEVAVD